MPREEAKRSRGECTREPNHVLDVTPRGVLLISELLTPSHHTEDFP